MCKMQKTVFVVDLTGKEWMKQREKRRWTNGPKQDGDEKKPQKTKRGAEW